VQFLRTNRAEVERLYREHGAALLLFAMSISRDRGRAQDAVHQVFLRMLENRKVDEIEDPRAYLFTCVRNSILNDHKASQRDASLDEESAWFDPPQRDYPAELNLRRALESLPEDQRQVLVLHVWGELTFLQTAEVLGISSNTAASRYRYALANLRESMCRKEDFCARPSR
jgi:RNA polymerase sigma-70 factor (ECF subfamily)